MATKSAQVSVTNSATRLDQTLSPAAKRSSILIRNRGSVAVYVGASDVATNSGLQIDAGEAISVDLGATPGPFLYGITASGTATCHVLQVGF